MENPSGALLLRLHFEVFGLNLFPVFPVCSQLKSTDWEQVKPSNGAGYSDLFPVFPVTL
jgi:hypothetical protein